MTVLLFPTDPADRFAATLDGLCQAVAARAAAERGFAPLALLLWGWLRRVAVRFAATAARVEAGTLRPPRLDRRAARRRASPPKPRLSRRFAWVLRAVPEARGFASQLEYFLADPEIVALLAAAPQLGRTLRPLCQMLGVRPAPPLPAPRRARPAPERAGPKAGGAPAASGARPARRRARNREPDAAGDGPGPPARRARRDT